jgi:Putative esterase
VSTILDALPELASRVWPGKSARASDFPIRCTAMALREARGPAGPPWEPQLNGTLDTLVLESELLASNPLGDPARRPLYVYRPPGVSRGDDGPALPSVYVIQGYTGQLDMWLARTAFEPTLVERLDALFSSGECPAAVVVFVDAWTSRGGSQFLNSTGTGRYLDYLCDEVVPFVDEHYPTAAAREHRGLTGKSSGGYGAMVVPMLRPEVFGALASHAGDALFECCYQPEFPTVARALRDRFDGSYEVFHERLAAADHFDWGIYGAPLEMYGYGCAYSPDPERPGHPLLPFEVATGRLVEHVWAQWLELDPVRMAPQHADALASMRRIYLDAGRSDEAYLDLGAQAFANELSTLGIEHTLELFDGRHGGIGYRYPGAIRELVLALD